jgi:ornithine cyclodeaminase
MNEPAILLSASDVAGLLDHRALLDALRVAMCAYESSPIAGRRAHSPLPAAAPHSVMIVFPGLVPGIPAYTVKINVKLPLSTPSVRGLIALHDLETGHLLAVMDSITITEVRTALVGALAAQTLARPDIRSVAILGAGVQGRAQLRALRLVRDFASVRVYDSRPERALALIADLSNEIPADFTIAPSVDAAVDHADVVITATWATSPIVSSQMIAPGTHVTAIGADEPGKAELSADLISRSLFVCDDRDLAVEMGALHGVGLDSSAIHASLGEVLSGVRPGRTSDNDITVFGSVGLPCQDLPAAWMAYKSAKTRSPATFDFHG